MAMAEWEVIEPYANIKLGDTPMWYQPSVGRPIAFHLEYKDDSGYNLATDTAQQLIFGVGTNWHTPFRSYIQPAPNGSGQCWLVNGDASIRVFTIPGFPASGTTTLDKDYESLTTLAYDAGLDQYTLTKHDGSHLYYGAKKIIADPAMVALPVTFYFLSRVEDPQGKGSNYAYIIGPNTEVRLDTITDEDGQVLQFSYVSKGPYAALISSVTGPFGLQASLQYDNNGFLTKITDTVSLESSFTYNSSNRLATLTTPYGTTAFDFIYPTATTDWYALRVTEHSVRKHFWFCGKLPSTLGVLPDLSTDRDALHNFISNSTTGNPNYTVETFDFDKPYEHLCVYWGPRQYDNLPPSLRTTKIETGTFDVADLAVENVNIGRLRKYLTWYWGYSVGTTLSLEKEPSADPAGSTTGLVVWYDYKDKIAGHNDAAGSMKLPRYQAWKLNATDWRVRYWEYNPQGKPITYIENYTQSGGTAGWRTQTMTYDATTGLDLIQQVLVDGATTHNILSNQWNTVHQPVVTFVGAEQPPTLYKYDVATHVTNVVKTTGLMTEYQYSASGFVQKSIDFTDAGSPIPLRTNAYVYTSGQLSSQTDERQLTTTYAYDKLWRLLTTRYPSVDNTGFTNVYDKLDIVLKFDRMGFTNQYFYTGFRELQIATNANFAVTTYDNCTCGALKGVYDPYSNATLFDYDNYGQRTKVTYPDGGGWVQSNFGEAHRLSSTVDSFGNTVNNTFNLQGLLTLAQDGAGLTLRSVNYDIEDNSIHVVDANGAASDQTFDGMHRVLTRVTTGGDTEKFGYSAGGLTAYTNGASTNTYVLDGYGRRKKQTTTLINLVTTNDYSPAGDLVTLADPRNLKTTWKYDIFGRVTEKDDNAGNLVFGYGYDADSRLTSRAIRTVSGTTSTLYTYDPAGNLLKADYPTSTDITFKYDRNNRLTNMVDAVGTSSFSYSGFGALRSEDGPWASDTVTNGYNNARMRSNLSLSQPNGGDWVESFGYDSSKRFTTLSAPSGSYSYVYSAAHPQLPEKLFLPSGNTITNDYDLAARLIRTHLTSSAGVLTNKHEYLLNNGGQRTIQFRGDASKSNYVAYTYDAAGELVTAGAKESPGSTTDRLLEQFGYLYDASGNLLSRTNGIATSPNKLVQSFGVNNLNQLTTGSRSGTITVSGGTSGGATSVTVADNGSSPAVAATLYASDGSFARAGVTLLNGANTFVASASGGSRSDSQSVTVSLPSALTYTYDAYTGALTSDGSRTFVYNDENLLTNVTVATQWKTDFVYDGKMRLRIRREFKANGASWTQTNEVRYVYDGNLVIQERDLNNTPFVTYTRGKDLSGTISGAEGIGGLLARSDAGSQSHAYYHADGNGNITAMVNEKQAVVARYLYDPFGNTLSQVGPLADVNVYRFSSKEYHQKSGLVYYLYRFYDPNLQRWPNRDPLSERGFECLRNSNSATAQSRFVELRQGPNLYCIVGNRPSTVVDANGLSSLDDCFQGCQEQADRDLATCNQLAKRAALIFGVGGAVIVSAILGPEAGIPLGVINAAAAATCTWVPCISVAAFNKARCNYSCVGEHGWVAY